MAAPARKYEADEASPSTSALPGETQWAVLQRLADWGLAVNPLARRLEKVRQGLAA